MQLVNALVGAATLGQGALVFDFTKIAGKDAAMTLLKRWGVDTISDMAAFTVRYVCDELGMPAEVSFVLSLLTGYTISAGINIQEPNFLVFGSGEYRYKIPVRGYSELADEMSRTDAVQYIINNEAIFFEEFSERARAAGLDATQIEEAFCTMRRGDYTKMATYFDTSSPVDGAVFWSGDKEAAASYANSIGGTVLEQTKGGQVFDDWRGLQSMYPGKWGMGSAVDPQPIWEALSTQYANGASGNVTYIVPKTYNNPESMWVNVEKPILDELKYDNVVTEITIIKE